LPTFEGRARSAPAGGDFKVEGTPVTGQRPLTDGETIQIGSTFLVFKSASAGVPDQPNWPPTPERR
jgi:hypothetical protein